MLSARVEILAVALGLGLGCSSSNSDAARSGPAAGAAGRGGPTAGVAGSVGQASAGQAGGGTAVISSDPGNGGHPSGGNPATGVNGGNGGNGGFSSSGISAGGADGGSSNGGAAASKGGSGGCVQNLACKLSPPPSTGDIYQDCVDRINQFLTQCACLPALTRRKDGEACADQMAQYDASMNSAHAGAIAEICQPSGSQNECPGYSSNAQVIGLCMQQMWDEGPPPTDPCTGSCYEQHGHFINMTDKTVTKVACGFHTTEQGKVWAAQNFSR
jgi:hypothetical protein